MQKKIGVAGVIGFDGTMGRHPSAALLAILPSLSHPIIPIYYYFVAYFMIANAIQFFFLPVFPIPWYISMGLGCSGKKKVPAIAIATKNAPNLSIGRLTIFYSKVIYGVALKPA